MCVSSDSNVVFPCKIRNININNKRQYSSVNFGFVLNVKKLNTLITSIFKDLMILGTASHAVMKFFHLEH